MHPLFSQAAGTTHALFGAAIEVHKAQLLSYMKLLDIPLRLVINFHSLKLTDGVSHLLLTGAKQE